MSSYRIQFCSRLTRSFSKSGAHGKVQFAFTVDFPSADLATYLFVSNLPQLSRRLEINSILIFASRFLGNSQTFTKL